MATAIQEYSPTAAALAELKGRMGKVVYEVTTTAGMDSAKKDRRELVTLRTSLESKRKEIKAPALERCRMIDEEAKRITAEILSLEEPIDKQIKAEEARKEHERQAKLEVERQRIAAITERIEKIKTAADRCMAMTSEQVKTAIAQLELLPIGDEVYQEFRTQAQNAKTDALGNLTDLYNEKVAAEAEAARIQAEKEAEEARLEAERQERDRLARVEAERLAAEQEKLRQEREAFERQQAEANAKREEEERKIREAREAEGAKLRAEREAEEARIRKEQEAAQAEIAKQQAELKRQQEEIEAARRKQEDEAAAEAKRKQAEAEEAERKRIAALDKAKREHKKCKCPWCQGV